MNKDFKKQLIFFDEAGYKKEESKQEAYLAEYDKTKRHLEEVLEIGLDDFDLSLQRTFSDIAKAWAVKYKKQNTLNLKPVKLMSLLDIPIEDIITKLDKLKIQKPEPISKDDFKIYTATPEENERLKVAKDFMKLLPKLKSKIVFQSPILAPVKMSGGTLIPNQYYIKSR